MKLFHLNCVNIVTPISPSVGHCLLIQNDDRLVLIDAGIGLHEVRSPETTLGHQLITQMGLQLDENITAIKQIQKLGFKPDQVTDCICSHLDPDHIGGLRDFENLTIHVSEEEYAAFNAGDSRYLAYQLAHNPGKHVYKENNADWFGLPARRIDLNLGVEILFIPLFGHTKGHCGVALRQSSKWLFYVGDAYYLRLELSDSNHPVNQLASAVAADNIQRLQSLEAIRTVIHNYSREITYYGYHDPAEMKMYD